MMIICDAILTAIFVKMFAMNIATNPVACLFVLCMITFLRMMMKLSTLIDDVYDVGNRCYEKEKDNLEKEESK